LALTFAGYDAPNRLSPRSLSGAIDSCFIPIINAPDVFRRVAIPATAAPGKELKGGEALVVEMSGAAPECRPQSICFIDNGPWIAHRR